MEFLNKLYESDYFGIGLFCVIAFLVVTFLIVLFFGKKDEKKRKLEATMTKQDSDLFKETTEETKVEVPINTLASEPINEPFLENKELEPVAPIQIEEKKIEEAPVVTPVIEPVVSPIIPEVPVVEPIKIEVEEVKPVISEPVSPIITENETPIVTPIEQVIEEKEEVAPILVEPTINQDIYYEPKETMEEPNIEVPNIDFDAIAKSISKELDDLEKNTEEIKVEEAPVEEVAQKPATQFSSVYVNEPAKIYVAPKTKIELPKKIDLPERKDESESYHL